LRKFFVHFSYGHIQAFISLVFSKFSQLMKVYELGRPCQVLFGALWDMYFMLI